MQRKPETWHAWGDLWQCQEGQGNKRGSERAWGSQQKWDTLSNTFNTQMKYEKSLIAVSGTSATEGVTKGKEVQKPYLIFLHFTELHITLLLGVKLNQFPPPGTELLN